MREITNTKIRTYKYDDEIMIDIVKNSDEFEAWVYGKNFDVKKFMFGVPINNTLYDEFIELVKANVEYYIGYYYGFVLNVDQTRMRAFWGDDKEVCVITSDGQVGAV